MSAIRHIKSIHQLRGTPRGDLRSWLRQSTRGNTIAFNRLIAPYIDLVLEYLAASGHTSAFDRRRLALQVFEAGFQRLGYTRRVSDFEFLLGRILFLHDSGEAAASPHSLLNGLAKLPFDQRFALVAREMEAWHPYWISLCTRKKRKQTHLDLLRGRAALLDLNLESFSDQARESIAELSRSFDMEWSGSRRQNLLRGLDANPEARAFKAEWLSMRCELIELRQDCRFPDDEREAFCRDLAESMRCVKPVRPRIGLRLRNAVSFQYFPEYHPS